MQVFFPLGALSQYIFGSVLFLLSMFIIAVILLQRGKGGGLTGALGGMGGQSAFGVKAGDVFTRITAVAVLTWIFTCALACYWYRPEKLDIEADVGSSASMSGAGSDLGAELPTAEPMPADNPVPAQSPPAQTPAPETQPTQTPETEPPAAVVPPATDVPPAGKQP
jgi:preprotein translocase subunit SecG